MLAANAAAAAEMTVDGSGALVLAALVGNQSKTLSPTDKAALARLLAGSLTKFPAEQTIMVTADKIDCKASNVDILEHSCTLTFGTMPRTIAGREAHELFATLIEAGVRPDERRRLHARDADRPDVHDRSERHQAEGRQRRRLQVRSRELDPSPAALAPSSRAFVSRVMPRRRPRPGVAR